MKTMMMVAWFLGAAFGAVGCAAETTASSVDGHVGEDGGTTEPIVDGSVPLADGATGDAGDVPVEEPDASIPDGLVPADLIPTVGVLIEPPATQLPEIAGFDARYVAAEQSTYDADFVPALPDTAAIRENHYGALRSRVQWAIRHGLPYGAGVTDLDTMYGRGRQIVLQYLTVYAEPNDYAVPPHNDTALADAEILFLLEGTAEAQQLIWAVAHDSTWQDTFGYYDITAGSSDPRQAAVALQSLDAAHRLGLPFTRRPGSPGGRGFNNLGVSSWMAAGEHRIDAILASPSVHADGSINSRSHQTSGQCGSATLCEAYFMNAMLATELLHWYGFVDPYPPAFEAARRFVDHMIAEQDRLGLPSLPYLSSGTGGASDLAAFQVWPALVLFQETGETQYRDHAIRNILAAQRSYVTGIKQFNQTYSTGAQNAEAMLDGVTWH